MHTGSKSTTDKNNSDSDHSKLSYLSKPALAKRRSPQAHQRKNNLSLKNAREQTISSSSTAVGIPSVSSKRAKDKRLKEEKK